MEPFLAIGKILQEKGHEAICAFPEQFRTLVEESNMQFASLGPEFIEMLESDVGKTALGGGGSGLKKIAAFVKLARMQGGINKKLVQRQFDIIEKEQPDRIVHNGKAMYPVIWAVKNKGKTTYISPVPFLHYVKGHTHVAFNSNYGAFLNKLTFKLADWGLVKTIMSTMKMLNIKGISQRQIKEVLNQHTIIYTISPTLFSRPDYWEANKQVLGYQERSKMSNWQPSEELLRFLDRNDKILFITFGSMTSPDPERKTRILLDILERNKIPAIINTASGGLVEPETYNKEHIFFLNQIPYDWIFPKVDAVIHHGGSGTTHLALKYGCASMIIPHIIDQFVWNKIICEKGLGPQGPKIAKMNAANLEPKILDLISNKGYKAKAEAVKKIMGAEDFSEAIYKLIVDK